MSQIRNDKDSINLFNEKSNVQQVSILEELIEKTENDQSGMFTSIRADAFYELGLIMFFRKEHIKAIKFIESAQKHFSSSKNIPQMAACIAELAWIYYNKSSDNLIRSLTLLNDAKYLLENQEYSEVKAKIYHYYALINYREKKFADSLKYFNKALDIASKDGIDAAKIHDSLGVHYGRVGDFQVAIRLFQTALKKKENIKNYREKTITQQLLGRLYLRIEDYDNSKLYLEEALEATKNLGGSLKLCRLYCEISKIYLYSGEFEIAKQYCQNSINIAREYGDKLAYAFSYLEYASVLLHQKSYRQVVEVLNQEVYKIFTQATSDRGIAFAKRIEAKCHAGMKDEAKAIEMLQESLDIFKELDMTYEAAKSHLELSILYRQFGDKELALSNIRESLKIAESEGHSFLIKSIEDEFLNISEDQWRNVVEKRSRRERLHDEGSSILEALSTLTHSRSTKKSNKKEPLISLLHVGQAMAAETDIDKLLIIITEETKQALNSDRATVFLLDRDKNELWSVVASGMNQQEIRFPSHMGLAGHVATTGEIINIEDAYIDSRFNKTIDKQTGYRTKTVLCIPMRNIKQEIIGVFQVINKLSGDFFSHEDEALLIAIASSASISIENARLFKQQAQLYAEQKKSFNSFINTLAHSIDAKDKITAGHSSRVTSYTLAIADQLNLSSLDKEVLEYAALLHDFGKIGIQDKVLCKEGVLTEEEYVEIKTHVKITKDILEKMYFQEQFKDVPEIASAHHEKYDGTGYFRGSKGEGIPLGGRIMAVADVFDAITSKRHYRDRMPFFNVLKIIKKDAGTHFDPKIVNIFFDIALFTIAKIIFSSDGFEPNDFEKEIFSRYTLNNFFTILSKDTTSLTPDELQISEIFQNYYQRK